MRVVIVVDTAVAAEDAAAITTGWRAVAPGDELVTVAPDSTALGAALDGAGLALVGVTAFEWTSLRNSLVTAVAGVAQERGVPCVVLAGVVSVGRREAAAVGVDAAYAVEPPGADPAAPAASTAFTELAERVARRWSRRSPIGGA